ncbi:Movement protein [Caenorhabditis elegans]|uniref:Movement protein n=1 Tax=Caenorhabditis elegans TaxID=6239 RepID=E0AHE1_CAEEL|nr:Movement protein [Caenorhabditis elegans]CBW44367.1 Movement protein [Caenorhabditis elegans]|eukprot:NP_001257254.1 Uncharacterized protein CELE_F09B12.7 [Caenorhabditis elegans]
MNRPSGYDVDTEKRTVGLRNLEERIFVLLLALVGVAFGGYVIYLMYNSVTISER